MLTAGTCNGGKKEPHEASKPISQKHGPDTPFSIPKAPTQQQNTLNLDPLVQNTSYIKKQSRQLRDAVSA